MLTGDKPEDINDSDDKDVDNDNEKSDNFVSSES